MNLAFASPWLLWGAALVAVPIVIHLLNRRRYVVVDFAALRFLTAAWKQRRRRLRSENLLLLLLRCLLLLLAALAMALPFVPGDSPLAALTGGRRELVFLVDRSGSMGRIVAPGVTADDRVLEGLRRRLGRLSDERGDAVSLVFLGGGATLAAPIGAPPATVLTALQSALPPPAGVADLLAGARLIEERIRPVRPGRLDIIVISDLQRLSWATAAPSFAAVLRRVLEGGGSVRIEPQLAEDGADNTGVVSLLPDEALTLAGEPLSFSAEVRNWSRTRPVATEARFLLDGVPVGRQRLDLPPAGVATASVRLRTDAVGPHHLELLLNGDELPFDDARTLAFEARQAISVLIVDGAPGGIDPLSWGSGYVSLALDPAGSGEARFRPVVRELSVFEADPSAGLADFDAIVLVDVGAPSAAAVAALTDAVSGGTPLLLFAGDRVQPELWNERFGEAGLLPARLGELLGDPGGRGAEDYVTLVVSQPAPPALLLFTDPRLAVLLSVPVFAWRQLQPEPDSVVLASFADALGATTPALVERRLGRGRIVQFGSSADTSWSLLPRHPALWLPLVQELLADLVAPDLSATNVPVGHAPTLVVDGLPLSAQLAWPSGAVVTLDRPSGQVLGDRSILRLEGAPLDEPGAYRLELRSSTGTETFALAAQPDAREGDLAAVDAASLPGLLDGLPFTLGDERDTGEEPAEARGDGNLAAALLWALLACALGESLLARGIARRSGAQP